MNRRNFFQMVVAVALGSFVSSKPTDFEARRQREDEDRAIRLMRLAQDHEEQLAQIQEAMREEFIAMLEEWAT